MDAKICNGCGVRLDDKGEYYTFQMFRMAKIGEMEESEPVRDLCLGCEAIFRQAVDVIDGKQK